MDHANVINFDLSVAKAPIPPEESSSGTRPGHASPIWSGLLMAPIPRVSSRQAINLVAMLVYVVFARQISSVRKPLWLFADISTPARQGPSHIWGRGGGGVEMLLFVRRLMSVLLLCRCQLLRVEEEVAQIAAVASVLPRMLGHVQSSCKALRRRSLHWHVPASGAYFPLRNDPCMLSRILKTPPLPRKPP